MKSAGDRDLNVDRRGTARERGGRFVCETGREEHNSWAHPVAAIEVTERLDVRSTEQHQSLLLS